MVKQEGGEVEPLVSVITPAYNAAKYLSQTIQSALGQTYKNIEIVVVDDGSTDGTEDLKVLQDRRVRYLKIKHSGGPATPRNVGIKKSRGDLIAFLDSDDVWRPEKLEKQISFMQKGGFDFVSSDAGVIDKNGKKTKDSYLAHLGNLNNLGPQVFPRLYESNFVITSSALVRREVFDKVGFFDQSPRMVGVEDYDLWLRISAVGAKFGFLPERLLLYRDRAGSLSDRTQSFNYERELRVVAKNLKMARKFLGAKSKLRPFNLSLTIVSASKGKNLIMYWKYKALCFWYFPFGTGSSRELFSLAKHIIKL